MTPERARSDGDCPFWLSPPRPPIGRPHVPDPFLEIAVIEQDDAVPVDTAEVDPHGRHPSHLMRSRLAGLTLLVTNISARSFRSNQPPWHDDPPLERHRVEHKGPRRVGDDDLGPLAHALGPLVPRGRQRREVKGCLVAVNAQRAGVVAGEAMVAPRAAVLRDEQLLGGPSVPALVAHEVVRALLAHSRAACRARCTEQDSSHGGLAEREATSSCS